MNFSDWIEGNLARWVTKALAALGFGTVTFTGWSSIKDQVGNAFQSAFGGLGGDAYQILQLGGVVDAVGVWMGAIGFAIGIVVMKSLGFIGSGSGS